MFINAAGFGCHSLVMQLITGVSVPLRVLWKTLARSLERKNVSRNFLHIIGTIMLREKGKEMQGHMRRR